VLGIRMLTFDTKTSLYTEDRGIQVPMTLEYLSRPAPRVSQKISIGTIRPIQVDHTEFLKWILKLILAGPFLRLPCQGQPCVRTFLCPLLVEEY
jgi:hypothetical protein